jgi:hypothetical protein
MYTVNATIDSRGCPHPHRTVVVEVGSRRAEIDEAIASLIEEIWRADIDTLSSCEENWGGLVWIEFPAEKDIARFLNVVAKRESGSDALYGRVLYLRTSDLSTPLWEFEVQPVDLSLSQRRQADAKDGNGGGGPPAFSFYYSILFPRCDLPILLERLRERNAGR